MRKQRLERSAEVSWGSVCGILTNEIDKLGSQRGGSIGRNTQILHFRIPGKNMHQRNGELTFDAIIINQNKINLGNTILYDVSIFFFNFV